VAAVAVDAVQRLLETVLQFQLVQVVIGPLAAGELEGLGIFGIGFSGPAEPDGLPPGGSYQPGGESADILDFAAILEEQEPGLLKTVGTIGIAEADILADGVDETAVAFDQPPPGVVIAAQNTVPQLGIGAGTIGLSDG